MRWGLLTEPSEKDPPQMNPLGYSSGALSGAIRESLRRRAGDRRAPRPPALSTN